MRHVWGDFFRSYLARGVEVTTPTLNLTLTLTLTRAAFMVRGEVTTGADQVLTLS